MPAEWAPHQACWMIWPVAHAIWPDLDKTRIAFANVANAIARFEPVKMLVDPSGMASAKGLCGKGVSLIEARVDDSWARDMAPSFLKNRETGALAGIDWRFNAWGGSVSQYQNDAQVANLILDTLGLPAYHSCLTLEGGAIHVDGEGTLITTESVVLNANRNFGMDKPQAEIELCRATGAHKVIWLPGDPDGITGDMTDGHVDNIACFIRPGTVLFEQSANGAADIAALEKENRRALERATDAKGRPLTIIDIHSDLEDAGSATEIFDGKYINFYLPNGGVIMPNFGVSSDGDVNALFRDLFPDREIISVDAHDIAVGGGGIHCITQQQPA